MAKTGLGRGLDALIAAARPPAEAAGPAQQIPLERIEPNPEQPRRVFGRDELESLAASIKEHGVLQPVIVVARGQGYRLVAGERRVQAARLAGLAAIPAVVRDDAAHSALELALVENLQREDLNAIEQAQAYRVLQEQYALSQDEIARRVGKGKSTVSNTMRLLAAPQELQDAVIAGQISEGHLRALLPLEPDRARVALREVILNQMSVRQTEALVRRLARGGRRRRASDPEVARAQDELRASLGTKVRITSGRRGGRITIDFYSAEEFERLYELLLRAAEPRAGPAGPRQPRGGEAQ